MLVENFATLSLSPSLPSPLALAGGGGRERDPRPYKYIILGQGSCDRNLTALRDDLAMDLFELEEEYYSSSYKWNLFDTNVQYYF